MLPHQKTQRFYLHFRKSELQTYVNERFTLSCTTVNNIWKAVRSISHDSTSTTYSTFVNTLRWYHLHGDDHVPDWYNILSYLKHEMLYSHIRTITFKNGKPFLYYLHDAVSDDKDHTNVRTIVLCLHLSQIKLCTVQEFLATTANRIKSQLIISE